VESLRISFIQAPRFFGLGLATLPDRDAGQVSEAFGISGVKFSDFFDSAAIAA